MPHFDLPSFRVDTRIFATIHEDHARAMVKFTPQQQDEWCGRHPGTVHPVPGRWGEGGATFIDLRTAPVALLRRALHTAWANVVSRRPVRNPAPKGAKRPPRPRFPVRR